MFKYAQVYWPGYLAPIEEDSVRCLVGWKNNGGQYCVGSHVSLEHAKQLPSLLENDLFLEDLTTKSPPRFIGICYSGNVTYSKLDESIQALDELDPKYVIKDSLILIQISNYYIPNLPTGIRYL